MKQINKKIWAFAILSVLVFTACDKANETTVDETSQGNTQSSVMEMTKHHQPILFNRLLRRRLITMISLMKTMSKCLSLLIITAIQVAI